MSLSGAVAGYTWVSSSRVQNKNSSVATMDYILIYSLSLLFYTTLTAVEEHRMLQHYRSFLEKRSDDQDGSSIDRNRSTARRIQLC